MSSWKSLSKANQKTHRERHQPENRKHLGLLEKKKDYRLRAKEAHQKEDTLKLLHKRALNRNPDEFYHHMIRSKIEDDGEHHDFDQPDVHTKEQLALMQTQDFKYITMKRTMETKKIQRLQSQLHMIDTANEIKNKHIFFVDDDDEMKNFDLAKKFEIHPSLINRKTNRIKEKDLEKMNLADIDGQVLKEMTKKRENAYNELKKRIEREKELAVIQQKMEIKRTLQQKRLLKPERVKPGTKETAPIYKFKYERKR